MSDEKTQTIPRLSYKQRVFVEQYLKCWNATEAARLAGYKHSNVQGPRLLVNVGIQAAIEARLADLTMSANEVLVRLADQARSSMADFVYVTKDGQIKISLANAAKLHLIRKISLTAEGGLQIELYDAQDALKLIGQHHKLFTQKHEVEAPDLAPLPEAIRELAAKVYGHDDTEHTD